MTVGKKLDWLAEKLEGKIVQSEKIPGKKKNNNTHTESQLFVFFFF